MCVALTALAPPVADAGVAIRTYSRIRARMVRGDLWGSSPRDALARRTATPWRDAPPRRTTATHHPVAEQPSRRPCATHRAGHTKGALAVLDAFRREVAVLAHFPFSLYLHDAE